MSPSAPPLPLPRPRCVTTQVCHYPGVSTAPPQVCHKLADLLPKRLGITPLLPPLTSQTSLSLHFCHQDIRNQLRVGAGHSCFFLHFTTTSGQTLSTPGLQVVLPLPLVCAQVNLGLTMSPLSPFCWD